MTNKINKGEILWQKSTKLVKSQATALTRAQTADKISTWGNMTKCLLAQDVATTNLQRIKKPTPNSILPVGGLYFICVFYHLNFLIKD